MRLTNSALLTVGGGTSGSNGQINTGTISVGTVNNNSAVGTTLSLSKSQTHSGSANNVFQDVNIGNSNSTTQSNGSSTTLAIYSNPNMSGTAAFTSVHISTYEQALGSGAQYALRYTTSTAQNGGGSLTDKWSVSNAGTMTSSGNIGTYVAKTGTYTILGTDESIECTSGTFTLTLPTAVGRAGQKYFITNSGSGSITLATTSSQTFVNVTATPTTLTLAQFDAKILISNGANWLAK